LGSPLKRVIGEERVIGGCSGKAITAVPSPSPTIESAHALRACALVVALSRP
jgi:hypothetical protein